MKTASVSIRFFALALLTGSLGLLGCEGEVEIDSLGNLHILQPLQGQRVQAHSVYVSVNLDSSLNPAGLQMFLNGQDVSSHLRKTGWTADGYVSGMVPGANSLLFSAPGSHGGVQSAAVGFTFEPKAIHAVDLQRGIDLAGLEGEVQVLIDTWGVPHIYTMEDNPNDLSFVQGYVTASHRLFQMDFFRKVAEGRLAELLGTALDPSVLETDLFLRTMFLTYARGSIELIYEVLTEEMAALFPEKSQLLTRFVEGVNAYIEDLNAGRNGAEWPQQHKLLNLLLGNYELEPMTVVQVLAIGRVQQYDLSNTLYEEIDRQARIDALAGAEAEGTIPTGTRLDLCRAAPPDPATVLKPGEPFYVGPAGAGVPSASPAGLLERIPAAPDPASRAVRQGLLHRLERIQNLVWGTLDRPYSNNWIVSPGQTASGFAILCNDPHLGLSNPSVFYPVHGDNKSFSGGTLNFSGCTFPGVPGLMLGQNERLAWGATVTNYDVTDVYEEVVTVDGDHKWVTYYGEQVPVQKTTQHFRIRGGDPVSYEIDFVPHHGPQLPGDPYSDNPGLSHENNLTVQWTGHYVTTDLVAFLGLLESGDIDGFFSAVEYFGVGAQNFVGADVNGEIGYFPHALVPVRKPAALTHETPPWLPLPGTGGYEWETDAQDKPRFLPPEDIPQARNPERGWLVTANNDITGQSVDNDPLNDGTPYLAYQYDEGYRNSRVTELYLGLKPHERDLDHMKKIQGDHKSLMAESLYPFFMAALSNPQAVSPYPAQVRNRLAEAKGRVEGWDFRCRTGVPDTLRPDVEPSAEDVVSSIASSIFFVWVNRVMEYALDDELAAAGTGLGSGDRIRALMHLLYDVDKPAGSPYRVHTLGPDGQSTLWDNLNTPQKQETRDEILVAALDQTLKDLESMTGSSDMSTWRWGKIHTLTLELEGLGGVLYAYNLPSYNLFRQIAGEDMKGYPRQGGWETVDPAGYSLHGLNFDVGSGPAMRMAVELEPGVMRAFNILPGGVNDLQTKADPLFNPVKIDKATHYGDQLELYLAHEYRPQLIFWEDVTQVAESRLQFTPK